MILMLLINSLLNFVSLIVIFSSVLVLVHLNYLIFPGRLWAPSSVMEMNKTL